MIKSIGQKDKERKDVMPGEIEYVVWGSVVLLFLILLDLVSRVAVAIKNGEFDWGKVLDFLKKNVAPYYLVWFAVAIMPYVLGLISGGVGFDVSLEGIISLNVISGAFWAFIVTKMVKSIFDNFKELNVEVEQK
jgi:hypothetical protein